MVEPDTEVRYLSFKGVREPGDLSALLSTRYGDVSCVAVINRHIEVAWRASLEFFERCEPRGTHRAASLYLKLLPSLTYGANEDEVQVCPSWAELRGDCAATGRVRLHRASTGSLDYSRTPCTCATSTTKASA